MLAETGKTTSQVVRTAIQEETEGGELDAPSRTWPTAFGPDVGVVGAGKVEMRAGHLQSLTRNIGWVLSREPRNRLTPTRSHIAYHIGTSSARNDERSSPKPSPKTIDKIVPGALAHGTANRVLHSNLNLPSLPMAYGGYAAKAETPYGMKKKYSVDELVNARDFQYINWDGNTANPTAKAKQTHRRGLFPTINVGLSYGKGQPKPMMLKVDDKYHDFIGHLILQPPLQRIAAFASCRFIIYDLPPLAYGPFGFASSMAGNVAAVSGSIFPCAAFNFGGNVWTFRHKDILNCPFGWCAITSLGQFDPTVGVLWELKDGH
ncbi:hypothetical protein F5146DRAFT_999182 [Armillaria mellea]|nr:hypothetical protein F5146DRAFT_999182 [Armillaria mellea]